MSRRSTAAPARLEYTGKRCFDIIAALLGLIVTFPLLALAAIGIRLSSRGPVLYRAQRTGRHGRTFTMYKLRTMRCTTGPAITAADDARVFPLGRWLRRCRIDELPQLFNVLRGDMSIIGPRPEDPRFVALHYDDAHLDTLLVRPGLTSPGTLYGSARESVLTGAQAVARYVKEVLPAKLALDLLYVREISLRYDLHILFCTLRFVARNLYRPRTLAAQPRDAGAVDRPESLGTAALGRGTSAPAGLAIIVLLAGFGSCEEETWITPQVNWVPVPGEHVLVGAGDVGWCRDNMDERTAELLDQIPGTVFTTGDNAYPHGRVQDFERCYEPSWGRHRHRTRPSPGNHEYDDEGARGYFAYFGEAAGEPGKGYYSYDLGAWHVIALNSVIDMDETSEQLAWLRADLAANPSRCTVAYWHHPRFNSGSAHGSSEAPIAFWEALYEAGAEIVINGHEHHYERFAPQTPRGVADAQFGIRQFIVGTGGKSNYESKERIANSEVQAQGVPGVLALRLLEDRYTWEFIPVDGQGFTDSGSGTCHDPPGRAATQMTRMPVVTPSRVSEGDRR